MNIDKIANTQLYSHTEIKVNGTDTLEDTEWNDISEAVQLAHEKINEIIDNSGDSALSKVAEINQISISCSPTAILSQKDESTGRNVTITAKSEATADTITVKDGSDNTLSGGIANGAKTKTITLNGVKSDAGNITYKAEVKLGTESKITSCNLHVYNALRYCVGPENSPNISLLFDNAIVRVPAANAAATNDPRGTYTFNTDRTNTRCYFFIPSEFSSINNYTILMGPTAFNLETYGNQSLNISGRSYNIYRSLGTFVSKQVEVKIS